MTQDYPEWGLDNEIELTQASEGHCEAQSSRGSLPLCMGGGGGGGAGMIPGQRTKIPSAEQHGQNFIKKVDSMWLQVVSLIPCSPCQAMSTEIIHNQSLIKKRKEFDWSQAEDDSAGWASQ